MEHKEDKNLTSQQLAARHYATQYRAKHREKGNLAFKTYKRKHPEKVKKSNALQAVKRKLDLYNFESLSQDDQFLKCDLLQEEIKKIGKKKKLLENIWHESFEIADNNY